MDLKAAIGILALLVIAYVSFFSSDEFAPQKLEVYGGFYAQMPQNQKYYDTVGGLCAREKCITAYLAPWCSACNASIPALKQISKELENSNTKLDIVITDGSREELIKEAKMFDAPVFLDPDTQSFHVTAYPTFVISDRKGNILDVKKGGSSNISWMKRHLNIHLAAD